MSVIRHVVCGMSGGVDSAVAAHLLKKKGYEVTGAFMRNWDKANETGVCMADHDLEDAKKVCNHIGIPLKEVNFVKQYWNNVFSALISGYELGLTPNVDVLCNSEIKFGSFYEYAVNELGADAVATGHYARNSVELELGKPPPQQACRLLVPHDIYKDQTLFLSQIPQRALRRTLFPVGHLTKIQVKDIATQIGLPEIAQRKESAGICFIGPTNFHNFIEQYIEPKPGNFINLEDGEIVGTHKGIHYWTVGQRCKIAGRSIAFFVQDVHPDTNDITVVAGTHHPALYCTTFTVHTPHWITGTPPEQLLHGDVLRCKFRFQQLQKLVPCTVRRQRSSNNEATGLQVTIDVPLRAVTKGQVAVFYLEDECLGGAVIAKLGESMYHSNQSTVHCSTMEMLHRDIAKT